ncbi:MAG: hypothetical protein EXX96DRAFT_482595, partial [Benjaminiella poitrasii]
SKIIHVKYCWGYCHRTLTDSTRLSIHLSKIRNIHITSIPRGQRCFDILSTTYIKKLCYGQNQYTNKEYGHPSCFSYFLVINSLKSHLQKIHMKQNKQHASDENKEN